MSKRKKKGKIKKRNNSLEKVALGGIASFLLVVLFPHGIKYFFRNWFAEIVKSIVLISLAGLFTQKIADTVARNARTPQQPPR